MFPYSINISSFPVFRGSRRRCYIKKGVLKNFIEKRLCRGLSPATLFKKRLQHRRFPVNFAKHLFYRTPSSGCLCLLRKGMCKKLFFVVKCLRIASISTMEHYEEDEIKLS